MPPRNYKNLISAKPRVLRFFEIYVANTKNEQLLDSKNEECAVLRNSTDKNVENLKFSTAFK
jgi:hypothetical protein